MASDYQTGRSYVMFNYDNIGWSTYTTSAQGYGDSTLYRSLFTSYSSLSYQLPILIGNTGKYEAQNCAALQASPVISGGDPGMTERGADGERGARNVISLVHSVVGNKISDNL